MSRRAPVRWTRLARDLAFIGCFAFTLAVVVASAWILS
jgi:hypothetical protein